MARTQNPNVIIGLKIRDHRHPSSGLRRRDQSFKIGSVNLLLSGGQGKAFYNTLHAPMAPVIEQIGRHRVSPRLLDQSKASGLCRRYDFGDASRARLIFLIQKTMKGTCFFRPLGCECGLLRNDYWLTGLLRVVVAILLGIP